MTMTAEQIARVCHEANRAYCEEHGDLSNSTWDMTSKEVKASAVKGVELAMTSRATPEQMHESWLKEKVERGWKWGPVKAPDLLEHPCCRPYSELPEKDRVKDDLFLAIVRTFVPSPFIARPAPSSVIEMPPHVEAVPAATQQTAGNKVLDEVVSMLTVESVVKPAKEPKKKK